MNGPYRLLSASTDIEGNRIEIGVAGADLIDIGEIAKRYGGPGLVHVVEAAEATNLACVNWFNCAVAPWRGGIAIDKAGGAPVWDCSSGFVVQGPGAATGKYILTAGHCGLEDLQWSHNGVLMGPMNDRLYADNMRADSAVIDINNSWDGNLVLIDEGNYRKITSQQVPSLDHVGDVVCHAGVKTMSVVGYSICGTLSDRDFDYEADGLTHLDFRKSNVNAKGGDSGAAVYAGNQALGILASGDGCDQAGNCTDTIYGHIYYAVTLPEGTFSVQKVP